MRKFCSVCAAPDAVRTAINEALANREPLRQIAARSAFSRASLSRHSRKCLPRQAIKEHRDMTLNLSTARHVVQWPEIPGLCPARFVLSADENNPSREIDEAEIRPDDILVSVEFEVYKPRNRKTAGQAEASAELRDVPPTSQALSHENPS